MAPVHIIPLPSSKNKSVMKQHTALGQLPYDKLEETLESARLKLFEKRDLAERTKQLIFLHIIGFRRVTDLRGGDVERIFRLKKDPDQYHYWHLTEDDRRCVPQSLGKDNPVLIFKLFSPYYWLGSVLSEVRSGPILREYEIVEGRDSMAMFDEALIRTRLEAILSAVLATKKREELLQLRKRSAKFTVFQNAHWKFQHILKKRCRHNGHRFILTGMVDYSLWYEEWRIAENTKLIVVISRMDGDMVSRRQALAYMGEFPDLNIVNTLIYD